MRVPGRVFASEKLLTSVFRDKALQQVKNVAHLPGIRKYSLAMPDIHWGYGFPIGGVAALDAESGVISPGGVGYDINCGVRFISTKLNFIDVEKKLSKVLDQLFKAVPSGVGSQNAIPALSTSELKKVLKEGAKWAIHKGYGCETDLDSIEEYGCLSAADPQKVSDRALKRGSNQLGTLGSGNHFVELARIREVYNDSLAQQWGLHKNQLIVMIHTGSRGLGHQICDDYVSLMVRNLTNLDFRLPDTQLACAYINSRLGRDYYGAMAAAANFAWANRQIIMAKIEASLLQTLRVSKSELGLHLIYDVCHNIAKFETHEIAGKLTEVCVHRKGATRAFGPASNSLSARYQQTGQPVIVPGDMGTESYLCAGTKKAMQETFGSSCHGAGRLMSRNKARKKGDLHKILHEIEFQKYPG